MKEDEKLSDVKVFPQKALLEKGNVFRKDELGEDAEEPELN